MRHATGNKMFWEKQLLELQTGEGEIYLTQITRIEDTQLAIQVPVSRRGTELFIVHGMPVTVYFNDGIKGLCAFDSRILAEDRIRLDKPRDHAIRPVQRRVYLRVPVDMQLTLRAENAGEEENMMFRMHDLGGGGLSFFSPHQMEDDQRVKGSFSFQKRTARKTVHFDGKIVSCFKYRDMHKISIEFVDMKQSVRSEIIKYCLFKQIELRNKLRNYPV